MGPAGVPGGSAEGPGQGTTPFVFEPGQNTGWQHDQGPQGGLGFGKDDEHQGTEEGGEQPAGDGNGPAAGDAAP